MRKDIKNENIEGISVNGIPLKEVVEVTEGAALYQSLKTPVYVYHKPPILRKETESKRRSPVKQYTRGEINQSYGKQAAIEACQAGKSVMQVCLHMLLTGLPVRTRDINDIYIACKKKIAGPSITGTMKRLESTDLLPLLKLDKSGRYHTWTLIKEATGILFEDIRALVNRMNKYDKQDLIQAYPELEEFYQPVGQPTEAPQNIVKKVLSSIIAQTSGDTSGTKPITFHFSFDFNINVNLSLKED